ncbi:MAG: DUF4129 domain-containing protein [Polyangiales bacterium]
MDAVTTDLRASGPLELLDGALLVARRGGGRLLLGAWAGASPFTLLALTVYYLERVEGVRSLRLLFALLLVLAFHLRSLQLSRVARAYALLLRPSLPVSERPTPPLDVICTASVVELGLLVWLFPLAGLAVLSPFAVAAALPFLSLRGAVAPSWLARASCADERGFSAFGQAFDDTSGMRGAFAIVVLLATLGMLGLFANLYALTSFALLLGHSMLGLDVGFVTSFLSPDNTLVLMLVAAATLLLMEPLWAAISAQAFVDARSRRDGADLHAAVDAAIAASEPRSRRLRGSEPPSAAAGLLLALALCGTAAVTHAQPAQPAQSTADAPEQAQPKTASDDEVQRQLSTILSQPEFREFAEHDSRTLKELLAKLSDWLDGLGDDEQPEPASSAFRLPKLSGWALMVVAAIALALIAVYVSRRRGDLPVAAAARSEQLAPDAPSEPAALLDDAARLAASGDFPGALRALYLATLFALDRGRLIEYEPSKTNWQYTRSLPRGELQTTFAAFTRIFDRTFYGHEAATFEHYQQCRQLAQRMGPKEQG